MGLFERFRRWRRERRLLRICGCICYCPSCREPLNDQECADLGDGRYRYTCRCGSSCTFDFAIAPAPVRVDPLLVDP